MGQGIQDFYFQAQKKGFSRDFQFRLVQIGGSALIDDDFVMVKTASMPGRSITTHAVPFMGLNFNIPGCATYPGSDGWEVTFHMTQDFEIRDQLERMSLGIMDEQSTSGIGNGGAGDLSLPGPENTIQLDLLNDNLDSVRSYFLIGTFVKDINPVSYNLQGTGEPTELNVSLAYQFWVRTPGVIGPTTTGNLLDKIRTGAAKVARVGQAAGDVSRTVGGLFGG